jgi:hypothetical protein
METAPPYEGFPELALDKIIVFYHCTQIENRILSLEEGCS